MFETLVAFIQGRGGVLDDQGRVINAQSADIARWSRELARSTGLGDPAGPPDPDAPVGAERRRAIAQYLLSPWRIVRGLFRLIGLIWMAWILWRFGGSAGRWLFQLSGVAASVSGLVLIVVLLLVSNYLSDRAKLARRDVQGHHGRRTVGERRRIFHALITQGQCPACEFPIDSISPGCDGCTRCPECGGAWRLDWWDGFLRTDRDGSLAHLPKRQRRRCCLFDAREQIVLLLADEPEQTRRAAIGACRARFVFKDWFVLLVLLLILSVAVLAIATIRASGNPLLFVVLIDTLMIGLLAWAIALAVRAIRDRKAARYACDQIDQRRCPSCATALDELHPIDSMLVCPRCAHAWDPDTRRRTHHSLWRIESEQIRQDPVFVWQPPDSETADDASPATPGCGGDDL